MDDCKFCHDCGDEEEDLEHVVYHEILECITTALDAKDPYTAGHSQRVSDMTVKICELLAMDDEEMEHIHIAAHLHDIGKIGVPDAALNKIEKLTDEEWKAIRKHPEIGSDILSKSKHLSGLTGIVRGHHERYDGKGYPDGLAGEEIPLGARIIAICDSIDAMTSNRCYRKAHDFPYAKAEIEKNLGTMYDPVIGRLVVERWDEVTSEVQADATRMMQQKGI